VTAGSSYYFAKLQKLTIEDVSDDQIAFFVDQIIFDGCISNCQVDTGPHKNLKPLSVDTEAFFARVPLFAYSLLEQ
jgi:uncharacterized membrane protein YukC